MSAYIMDFIVKRVRKTAWSALLRAYAPSLPTTRLKSALYLATDAALEEWLAENDAVLNASGDLDIKKTKEAVVAAAAAAS